MTQPERVAVKVGSEYLPDGTYTATIALGPDRAWSLTAPRARRYAAAITDAATRAEHDAATYAAMACHDLPDDLCRYVVGAARAARASLDRWTAPLVLAPGITAAEPHRPFVAVRHMDAPEEGWQWTPAQARQHASFVLHAVSAAELDNIMAGVLAGMGIPPDTSAAVLDHLAAHWPEEEG